MFYRKCSVVAGVGLAAVTPLILHRYASPDCNQKIALCAVSDAPYLLDDPAPKPSQQFIFGPPVAGSTASMPSSQLE